MSKKRCSDRTLAEEGGSSADATLGDSADAPPELMSVTSSLEAELQEEEAAHTAGQQP